MAEAYLKDPEMNAKYVAAAVDLMTEQYGGDMTAAVIATAPGGGEKLAERWVKSKHDESILPPSVRRYYRNVMSKMAPPADLIQLPIITDGEADLTNVDVAVLERFEGLQSAFGSQLPIISGYRDPAHNKRVGGADRSMHLERRAIDIDVTKLSEVERVRFIEMASAMGFTGIGVYSNSLHLDTGSRRGWGPSYKSDSIPAWARDVMAQHTGGTIATTAPRLAGVAPEFSVLSFDQRLKLDNIADQEIDRQRLDLRAGLDIVTTNAPAAVATHGFYDGEIPGPEAFVAAYGAVKGMEEHGKFDSSMQVADSMFSMRTMSADEILDLVESYTPTSTGNDAAMELRRFEQIQTAAQATIKERNDDPIGYVRSVFPGVDKKWTDAEQSDRDPDKVAQAISMTELAQRTLGIEDRMLLPKAMAKGVADMWSDEGLSPDERIGAVAQTVFQTADEDQQDAIINQLISEGLPPMLRGAFIAASRGDTEAATYLFKSALVGPGLPDEIGGIKEITVKEKIGETVFDENQIGWIMSGLDHDSTGDNQLAAQNDRALFTLAAKLHLADGSATNLKDALQQTARQMYGDVKTVIGGGVFRAGVKIVTPAGEDETMLLDGFDALLGDAGDAFSDYFTPIITGATTADSQRAVFAVARDNAISALMEEGYFVMYEGTDKYTFIDPHRNKPIEDSDGLPLVWTKEEVLAAGAAAGKGALLQDVYERMRRTDTGIWPEFEHLREDQ
jgi:hypothetical protein